MSTKKKVFKVTGIVAAVAFMASSFLMSGTTTNSSSDMATTLESVSANAFGPGCEGSGVCILAGQVWSFAPVN